MSGALGINDLLDAEFEPALRLYDRLRTDEANYGRVRDYFKAALGFAYDQKLSAVQEGDLKMTILEAADLALAAADKMAVEFESPECIANTLIRARQRETKTLGVAYGL